MGAHDYVTKENITKELPQQVLALLKANSQQTINIKSIISSGETSHIEFKSTLRFNLRANKIDPIIELSTLKTIAAFLNSSGGMLIIGVSDEGTILGLEQDKFKNMDSLQLHFWNLLRQTIGPEFSEFIKANIINVDNKFVLSVLCNASNRPVFLKWKESGEPNYQDIFYIRAGPQTERLGTRQAIEYIKDHYP